MVSDAVARELDCARPVGGWRCPLTVPARTKLEYPRDAGNCTSGLLFVNSIGLCAALFSTQLCRLGREFNGPQESLRSMCFEV